MKRALITGGSGNIGAAICYALAQNDIEILVHTNNNEQKAKLIVENIIKQGGKAASVSFDISDQAATLQAINTLLLQGVIQIVVNNAGITDDAIFAGMSPKQWQNVINTNLNGFFNVTNPLMLPMMRTRWGRIISISSIAGIMGNKGQANYAASKAGLIGATKSLAIEMASRGITANIVAPGIISGKMSDSTFDKATIKAIVPMQRAGSPEEVAALVAFLASDSASYISSQVIGVNGAMV